MADEDLSIKVRIGGVNEVVSASSELGKALRAAGKEGEDAFAAANRTTAAMTLNMRQLFAAAGGFVAFRAAARFIGEATAAARGYEAEQANLRATLAATGNVIGMSVEELNAQAAALEEVTTRGGDFTTTAQAMLLTFKAIGRDVFPEVVELSLDMARKFGGDVSGAAVQLGKALQDPIQGVAALRRVGVQLSTEQEAQIRQFVRLGEVQRAQRIILAELQSQIGGVERAYAQTDAGREDRQRERIENLKETLGLGLLPVIVETREEFIQLFERAADSGALVAAIEDVSQAARDMAALLGTALDAWKGLRAIGGFVNDPFDSFSHLEGLTRTQIAMYQELTAAEREYFESAPLPERRKMLDQKFTRLTTSEPSPDYNEDLMPARPLPPPRLSYTRSSTSSVASASPIISSEVQVELQKMNAELATIQAAGIVDRFTRERAGEVADFAARKTAFKQQLDDQKITEEERTQLVGRARRNHTARLEQLHTAESLAVADALRAGNLEIEGIIADRSSNPFAKARLLEAAENAGRIEDARRAQAALRAALATTRDPAERSRLQDRIEAQTRVISQTERRQVESRTSTNITEDRDITQRVRGVIALGGSPVAQYSAVREQLAQAMSETESMMRASFDSQIKELGVSAASYEDYGQRLAAAVQQREERMTALTAAGETARAEIARRERDDLTQRIQGIEAQGAGPFGQYEAQREQLFRSVGETDEAIRASFDAQLEELERTASLHEDYGTRVADLQAQRQDRLTSLHRAGAQARNAIDRQEMVARMEFTAQLTGTLLQAWGAFYSNSRKNAGLHKAIATGEALMNTALAVSKAIGIYGPTPHGFALATAAGVLGAAQVTQIQRQRFARGGIVEGAYESGDMTSALVNAGEMILNRPEQARLFAIATGRAPAVQAPERPAASPARSPVVLHYHAPSIPSSGNVADIHAWKQAALEDKEGFATFLREEFIEKGLL